MDKKIKKIIKLLYDLKTDNEFYFTTYGTDLLEDLINSAKEECTNSLISLDFDTEYLLEEFREIQHEIFDDKGEAYRGSPVSHNFAELVLKIINGLDNYAKAIIDSKE